MPKSVSKARWNSAYSKARKPSCNRASACCAAATSRSRPPPWCRAKLGTKFGLRYQLLGKVAEDTPLTLLYFTPGIRTADGQRHDKFEVTQKLVPGAPQDVMAYEFTESHEVVPGEWRFMVVQGDRLLTQKSFTVR